MTEKIPPNKVALLDPFGKGIPASRELEELLAAGRGTGEPEAQMSEIITFERNEWLKVLGSEVEVLPLPSFVIQEVMRNLERFGFELRFIPALDLDALALREKGVVVFLKELAEKYPNWKPYESLNEREKSNHTVVRNLHHWFWKQVGNIDFPELPGQWLAVETLEKPAWGREFPRSPLTDRLGFSDRFNLSWDEVTRAIWNTKQSILSEIGLSGHGDIRLLEALEWNLLANREGWGKTNSSEWTNTEYRPLDVNCHLFVGNFKYGGAAHVIWERSDYSSFNFNIGFRVAVVFKHVN